MQYRLVIHSHRSRELEKPNHIVVYNNTDEDVKIAAPKASQSLTNRQDTKRANRSGDINSHMPFIVAGSNVVEAWRGRRDLIPRRHCHRHLVDAAKETKTTLKEKKSEMDGSPLLLSLQGSRTRKGRYQSDVVEETFVDD